MTTELGRCPHCDTYIDVPIVTGGFYAEVEGPPDPEEERRRESIRGFLNDPAGLTQDRALRELRFFSSRLAAFEARPLIDQGRADLPVYKLRSKISFIKEVCELLRARSVRE